MSNPANELYSAQIVAGSRNYGFTIKQSSEGANYLVITESQIADGKLRECGRVMVVDDHRIVFRQALRVALQFLRPQRPRPPVSLSQSEEKTYEVAEMRQQYPMAYAKWTDQDDSRLAAEYKQGKTIAGLAQEFQRKPGAIASRLRRLGLVK